MKIVLSTMLLGQVGFLPLFAQTPGFLQLTAIEGESALNDVKHKVGHPPSVRVTDEAGKLIPGAEVTFTLPTLGPGAIFPNGSASATVTADNVGVAHCPPYKPNIEEGRFNIMVTGKFGPRTGSVVISQSNTSAVSQDSHGHTKVWVIVAVVAGGAIGGVVAATHHGGTPAPAPPTPTTLSVGGITVGGPQ